MPGVSRRDSTERETHMEVTQINEVLRGIVDPDTGLDLIAGKYVRQVAAEHGHVGIQIEFGYPAKSQFDAMRARITEAVGKLPGVERVAVEISQKIVAHAVQRGVKLLPNVKNIVAVASGKGGVGKSTTAVNLALALAAEGANVGILDADIYGPSLPTLLGIHGKPESKDGKTLEPMVGHGLQASSIGFLIEPDNPMVWRGPMVTQALEQLLNQTNWHDLDYLIVDMPPGTGDIQLTLAQKVPVTGAVIVTTPQDLALLDARKGLKMFEKVGVPILGLIENMSLHICSNCGHEEPIFGVGGGERMSHDFDVDLLGKLPLEMSIRVHADAGMPSVVGDPDGRVAELYKAIARKVAVKIASKQKDMTSKFPSIVVQNT
ncbi:iron-sulfur cluster carrier protein ApbC [Pandoraea pnomenusa]|uniref:iron-sulfur cluster carrier protein ApbC n=1 Tax=Pandoraea pnomenusa TaxID=93220 RepID=UPI0009BF7F5A|nr:iron-sulfur cluster carrier protein ApbC [Pandoraea pnomenusa]QDH58894.1 iron-sulfur cluster carrier protein ApbC [Pandoraea pnomenusa]